MCEKVDSSRSLLLHDGSTDEDSIRYVQYLRYPSPFLFREKIPPKLFKSIPLGLILFVDLGRRRRPK